VPWLSALILKPDSQIKKPRLLRRIEEAIDHFFDALEGFYRRALAAALANKGYALAIAAAFLIASAVLLSMLTVSFLPPTDTGEFEIHVETPRGYSLERTAVAVDAIDSILRRAVPEIEAAVFYVGAGSAVAITPTPNRAFGRIRLVPSEARKRTIQEILPLVQEALSSGVPDADITVLNGGFDALLALGTGGQGFQMEIYGPNLEAVTASAQEALRILERDPAVFKAELSVRTDAQQLYADLSQVYMGRLGVSPYEAGITSRILFAGMQAGRLRAGDEDYDIRLDSDLTDAPVNEDTLNAIVLRTRDGRRLSFSAFSTMEARPALSRIDRRNRSFSVDVRGYLRGEDQGGVTARMNAAMAAASLPAGVRYRVSGTSELIGDSMRSLVFMLAISVFLVYSVMVIQFERFMQPLIIMAAIPFCMIGVALGLYLFGSGLSIIAMLAIIALGGTVVNNAIVLVDYTNQLRRDYGMERRAAVIQGAGARLRPILMTALTTIFGVLPMALAAGNGSEVYAPLGQAIFGGLISSTLITLVIVPLLYDTLEKRVAYIPAPHTGGALEGQHYEAPHVE
jgi:HAE1 family hydrophobic/amphiphilic exporter-1